MKRHAVEHTMTGRLPETPTTWILLKMTVTACTAVAVATNPPPSWAKPAKRLYRACFRSSLNWCIFIDTIPELCECGPIVGDDKEGPELLGSDAERSMFTSPTWNAHDIARADWTGTKDIASEPRRAEPRRSLGAVGLTAAPIGPWGRRSASPSAPVEVLPLLRKLKESPQGGVESLFRCA